MNTCRILAPIEVDDLINLPNSCTSELIFLLLGKDQKEKTNPKAQTMNSHNPLLHWTRPKIGICNGHTQMGLKGPSCKRQK